MSAASRCTLRISGPDDAPAVLLLHAIATSSDMWAMQVPVLSRRFRVLCADLPGYGSARGGALPTDLGGYADAVAIAMETQGIASAVVVGVSFGGMVAQRLALSYPGKVSALVLAHCGARTLHDVARLWDGRLAAAQDHGMAGQVQTTLERWLTPDFLRDSPRVAGWIADMIRDTDIDAYCASIRAIQRLDHWGDIARIRAPTLCIAGSLDVATPPGAVLAMAERIAGSEWCLMESAPHLAAIENGHRFTEEIGRFLGRQLLGK